MAALRGAILKHSPQPPPEYISGHTPSSTPDVPERSELPHIALMPSQMQLLDKQNLDDDFSLV